MLLMFQNNPFQIFFGHIVGGEDSFMESVVILFVEV